MSRIQCRHHRTAKQEYVVVYTPVLMKLIYHLCIGGDLLLVSSSLELKESEMSDVMYLSYSFLVESST